jgi:hypothetical protein
VSETGFADPAPKLGTGRMGRVVLFRTTAPISEKHLQVMQAIAARVQGLKDVKRLRNNQHGALILADADVAEKLFVWMCSIWREEVTRILDEEIPPPPGWNLDEVWRPTVISWDPGDAPDSPTEANDLVLAGIVEKLVSAGQKQQNVVKSARDMELASGEPPTEGSPAERSPAALAAELRSRLAGSDDVDADEALRAQLVEDLGALASERERAIGEVLGSVALLMARASKIRNDLQETVHTARQLGVSWPDIAKAAGITYQAAMRRWEPEAKRKHTEYQRDRGRRGGST